MGAFGLGLALVTAACATDERSQDGPIKVGSIMSESGPMSVYGEPMALATQLAVDELNDRGGVLGKQLELVSYDGQSDNAKYAQLTNNLIQRDQVAVLMGGTISSEREAIRQITGRHDVPYFFNQAYEGGLCDGKTFLGGTPPSQQLSVLVPWAIEEYGEDLYILAADYNYGHNSAHWAETYATQNGGNVLATEYVPLATSDFGSIINDIQAKKPSFVYSLLVGADHMAFYRQFSASGLADSTRIVSSSFGAGSEHTVLGQDAAGVVAAFPYFPEVETPENDEFLTKWIDATGDDSPPDSAVTVWNAWHLWAAAVEKAGTTDIEDVQEAIAEGVRYEGPSGPVSMDQSHHVTQNITIAEADGDGGWTVVKTVEEVAPAFEQESCDLAVDPSIDEQHMP